MVSILSYQSRFLDAPLVRQDDGELKNSSSDYFLVWIFRIWRELLKHALKYSTFEYFGAKKILDLRKNIID